MDFHFKVLYRNIISQQKMKQVLASQFVRRYFCAKRFYAYCFREHSTDTELLLISFCSLEFFRGNRFKSLFWKTLVSSVLWQCSKTHSQQQVWAVCTFSCRNIFQKGKEKTQEVRHLFDWSKWLILLMGKKKKDHVSAEIAVFVPSSSLVCDAIAGQVLIWSSLMNFEIALSSPQSSLFLANFVSRFLLQVSYCHPTATPRSVSSWTCSPVPDRQGNITSVKEVYWLHHFSKNFIFSILQI